MVQKNVYVSVALATLLLCCINTCACTEQKDYQKHISLAQAKEDLEEDGETSENDVVRQARKYLTDQKENLENLRAEIEQEKSSVSDYPALECENSLQDIEDNFKSLLSSAQEQLQMSLETSLEDEKRARNYRLQHPINRGQNYSHLSILQDQINEMRASTETILKDWAVEELSLKQKEADLNTQLKLIQAAIEEANQQNEKISSDTQDLRQVIVNTDHEYHQKIANIDKAIYTQRSSQPTDVTRNNPWYDAAIQCTTQITQIETIIETKEIEIEMITLQEIVKIKSQTKSEIAKLNRKFKKLKETILSLVEKKTEIIVSGQTFAKINALLVLDRKIISEREKLKKVAKTIESKQKILQDKFYEQKYQAHLKSIDEKISQTRNPVFVREQLKAIDVQQKKFNILPQKPITVQDVKKKLAPANEDEEETEKKKDDDLFDDLEKPKPVSIFKPKKGSKVPKKNLFSNSSKPKPKTRDLFSRLKVNNPPEANMGIFKKKLKPKKKLGLFEKMKLKNKPKGDLFSPKKQKHQLKKKGKNLFEMKKKPKANKKSKNLFESSGKKVSRRKSSKKNLFESTGAGLTKKKPGKDIFKNGTNPASKRRRPRKNRAFFDQSEPENSQNSATKRRHRKSKKTTLDSLLLNKGNQPLKTKKRKSKKTQSLFEVNTGREQKTNRKPRKSKKKIDLFKLTETPKISTRKNHRKKSNKKTVDLFDPSIAINKAPKKKVSEEEFQKLLKDIKKQARVKEAEEDKQAKQIQKEHRMFKEFKKVPRLPGKSETESDQQCKKIGIITPDEMLSKGKTLMMTLSCLFLS